jgi:hypothetical protein
MYDVKFYKGDYLARQRAANEEGCVAYVEHHFNSTASEAANYAVVITGSNASQTSKNWGRWYARAVSQDFDVKIGGDNGILVGGYGGRGDYNLRFTNMPAILLEPLFVSHPQSAELVRSDSGQQRLAMILCDSIKRFFPDGGRIGFSVGHKYKTSRPNDRGASVVGGGYEADYAELVLTKAQALLKQVDRPQERRELTVMQGTEVLWQRAIDEDATVRWDAERGILRIDDDAGT